MAPFRAPGPYLSQPRHRTLQEQQVQGVREGVPRVAVRDPVYGYVPGQCMIGPGQYEDRPSIMEPSINNIDLETFQQKGSFHGKGYKTTKLPVLVFLLDSGQICPKRPGV